MEMFVFSNDPSDEVVQQDDRKPERPLATDADDDISSMIVLGENYYKTDD